MANHHIVGAIARYRMQKRNKNHSDQKGAETKQGRVIILLIRKMR